MSLSVHGHIGAALIHGKEGWTALMPAHSTRSSCPAGSDCCRRHPRAAHCTRAAAAAAIDRPSSVVLRSDLFIESDSQPSGAPPTVVRAYEACTSSDSLQARMSQARNESRAARAALAAAPLPMVAIIFFGTHFERLPLLRAAYEPYFHSIVYMSPSADIAKALRKEDTVRRRAPTPPSAASAASSLLRVSSRRPAPRRFHYHCRAGLKVTYACVAGVAAKYGTASGVEGVLYLHFDMWLHPWALLGSLAPGLTPGAPAPPSGAQPSAGLLRSLWSLPAGRIMIKAHGPTRLLPLSCFNASRPAAYRDRYLTPSAPRLGGGGGGGGAGGVPSWTWTRDVPPARAALRTACADGRRCDADRLCIGWADLYYVPRRLYADFGSLARALAAESANAELAVPTMLHALSSRDREQQPLRRLPCWGFCCSTTSCPELMLRHACGHRMRLDLPRVRAAFRELTVPGS